jgi:hypothetical protein
MLAVDQLLSAVVSGERRLIVLDVRHTFPRCQKARRSILPLPMRVGLQEF